VQLAIAYLFHDNSTAKTNIFSPFIISEVVFFYLSRLVLWNTLVQLFYNRLKYFCFLLLKFGLFLATFPWKECETL